MVKLLRMAAGEPEGGFGKDLLVWQNEPILCKDCNPSSNVRKIVNLCYCSVRCRLKYRVNVLLEVERRVNGFLVFVFVVCNVIFGNIWFDSFMLRSWKRR